MLFPEFKFIGLKSDLRSKTNIVPMDQIPLEPEGECYSSIYRFDSSVLKHESLADLPSDIRFYSDYLVFDLDSVKSLDFALQDAKEIIQALKAMGAGYEAYFSGNKGFHVLVPSCQFSYAPTSDENILKRMAMLIAGRFDTFDRTIYNKTRIFRVPNSLNAKSGLYKVPLPGILELGVSDILALAKEPLVVDYPKPWKYNKSPMLTRVYDDAKQKVNRYIQATEPKESYGDWGIIKTAQEGERNQTLYKMARDLARHGIYERDALIILGWWNKDQQKPLDGVELGNTIKSAYRKGVNPLVPDEGTFQFAFDSAKALKQVRNVYSNFKANGIRTGFDFLDKYTLNFFKEEVIFILARPRNFKTALLSNLLQGIATNTNRPCIFFSQEMGVESLSVRHIQKSEKLTQSEVLDKIQTGEEFPRFVEEFKNVYVVGLSSLNTDKILNMIDQFLETHGSLGAIGFDYLSLFEGCANDTARTARMATELKTRIAKAAGCPTFCLVQAKREYEGEEGNIEIDLTAGKDSSSIEDSGDYVIGVWGHWEEVSNFDPVTGDKLPNKRVKNIYGRFLKSRKFLSGDIYTDLPYFKVEIDKPHMDVRDIRHISMPPVFKQKESRYGSD
jgi:DnaB-like helicase C terminal domain/Primase C terminal 1 (PriCT-1)